MTPHRSFTLDRFQLEAIRELDRGHSVLVAAPTGSGKTVVAEAAIDLALAAGGKAFYTAPIKALSNQKYVDLCGRLGPGKVGLLTGDVARNGDAPIVVMTTEVLRNMIYSGSDALVGLQVVVLDEVHYLQDAYRGPVWEEIIIHLPQRVRLVCLSATVSNAAELGEWIGAVRGPTATVVETERPVQLEPLYLVGDRTAEQYHLIPVLVDGQPNPAGARFTEDPRRLSRTHRGRPRRRFFTPRRVETIERLAEDDLLPTIHFIFSRAACDDAVGACRDAGLRLTSPEERSAIRAIADSGLESLSDSDLDALEHDLWLESLEMGVAAHHAGLLPAFKEVVEKCFTAGLVKAVFATETLALGINMPARSVVVEKLTKYNGERHEFLTPGEFTQLTGRAGRRGLDEVGYAIVDWSPFVPFERVADLVSSRSFPLSSSFRPTYNMAANLMRRYSREEAHEVLGQSFAQFQADRAMVGLQRRLYEDRRRLGLLDDAAGCELGDIADYAALLERVRRAERRQGSGAAAVAQAAGMLRPGDLIELPAGVSGRLGPNAVVISVAHRGKGAIRIRAVDGAAELHRFDAADLDSPLHPHGHADLPTPYAPENADFIDACAALVVLDGAIASRPRATMGSASDQLTELREELANHPAHACPDLDAHLAAIGERAKVQADTERLQAAVQRRSGLIAARLDAVVDLLGHLGCAHGWALTERGERLASIYHESDLLMALALDEGIFDGLSSPEMAATVSACVYEERRKDVVVSPRAYTSLTSQRLGDLDRLARELRGAERERGLPVSGEPDRGFAHHAWSWARGEELVDVLGDDFSAGDFVRNVKLLIDVLGQIAVVAPKSETASVARDAARSLLRGVVAAGEATLA